MVTYVYVPDDIGRGIVADKPAAIVGFAMKNAFVVVDYAQDVSIDLASIDPDLCVIGAVNETANQAVTTDTLFLRYTKLPYVDTDHYNPSATFSVVLFTPPNLRNFEYFTCNPILLQSTGQGAKDRSLIDKLDQSHFKDTSSDKIALCNDVLLDTINRCLLTRIRFRRATRKHRAKRFSFGPIHSLTVSAKSVLAAAVHWGISIILHILVSVILLLDCKIRGFVPVKSSSWCRQLDIRLRQISFIPLQFMSYHDHRFLSEEVRSQLQLPHLNKRHNINNSNYINLYNTIWLIVNDVLLGRTLHRLIMAHSTEVWHFLNVKLLKTSFVHLEQFISWIGSDHPAGFKLNNDLGPFLESMFMWTSQTWTGIFDQVMEFVAQDSWMNSAFKVWFCISCSCGCSFLIASFIDYIKLCCLHVYFFSKVSTKIYHQQIAMLQSLTQLFRGRKYNVLRKRIDSIEQDKFHIDQLFLGILCFITMAYLLPTTFAFYILFFVTRMSMLTVLKLGEKAIVCSNLLPLFVFLLKLKNSKRLQGGVYFERMGSTENADCVVMRNKALTFEEIFENFITVLHQEGKFERLMLNFLEGEELKLRDTSSMKFHYLMLPGNIESLLEVWSEQALE